MAKRKKHPEGNHPVLVKNYGLYWDRMFVDWKKKQVCGKLAKRKDMVNFWKQRGIYVLYSKENVPIYFGQAGIGNNTLGDRLKQHTSDDWEEMWDKFSWFGFCKVKKGSNDLAKMAASQQISTVLEVNLLEAILITILPTAIMNKQDGKWKKVKAHRYLQFKDNNVRRDNDEEYGTMKSLEDEVRLFLEKKRIN